MSSKSFTKHVHHAIMSSSIFSSLHWIYNRWPSMVFLLGVSKICFTTRNAKPLDNLKTRQQWSQHMICQVLLLLATNIKLPVIALSKNAPPFACVHITFQATIHIWINRYDNWTCILKPILNQLHVHILSLVNIK